MLVDSHCHLDFPDFTGELDAVVARAADAGVDTLLTICTHVTRFPQVRAVAERFDNVFCTVGIHPHEAAREPAVTVQRLITLAGHPKVVGFGETGLDYYYEHSPREAQQESFRIHIAAARQAGLPVIVHTRDAEADTARILAEEQARGAFPGLLHCFSGSRQLADKAIELGLYISFSGVVTFKKAETLQQIARDLPLDRILVETDAPYLAPVPKRGRRNEPAFVAYTAAEVARLRGMAVDAFALATSDNFFRLFAKVPRR
ncbi:MAG: TatD family deoxyribonuclease [Rhodospirillales bacterium]|nr:MAG: TatD family deoxyribonuclease [Rhodospirillales bacterium]